MSISSFDLNGEFSISFEPGLGYDLEPDSYFILMLPGYDTMFVPESDTLVCYIDAFITPCIGY